MRESILASPIIDSRQGWTRKIPRSRPFFFQWWESPDNGEINFVDNSRLIGISELSAARVAEKSALSFLRLENDRGDFTPPSIHLIYPRARGHASSPIRAHTTAWPLVIVGSIGFRSAKFFAPAMLSKKNFPFEQREKKPHFRATRPLVAIRADECACNASGIFARGYIRVHTFLPIGMRD